MSRARTLSVLLASALALAACGDDGDAAATRATPEPTSAPVETATPEAVAEATPEAGECDEVKYTPEDATDFTHPESNFYEPDATAFPTKADLDHLLLADNAVVVTYAADTGDKRRKRLYDWTYAEVKERTPIVVPDDSPGALPVRARIATVELRCNGFDWERLTAFANRTDIAPLPRKD